jgi:hypothetical protein
MPSSTTRTVGPAVNTIDASALESLEAVNHRLKEGGITLRLSEVKGPVMDRLKRSHFLEELTGKVHLTQYDAVASLKPDLARRTLTTDHRSPITDHWLRIGRACHSLRADWRTLPFNRFLSALCPLSSVLFLLLTGCTHLDPKTAGRFD